MVVANAVCPLTIKSEQDIPFCEFKKPKKLILELTAVSHFSVGSGKIVTAMKTDLIIRQIENIVTKLPTSDGK